MAKEKETFREINCTEENAKVFNCQTQTLSLLEKKTITCNIYEIDVFLIFHYIDFDCVS